MSRQARLLADLALLGRKMLQTNTADPYSADTADSISADATQPLGLDTAVPMDPYMADAMSPDTGYPLGTPEASLGPMQAPMTAPMMEPAPGLSLPKHHQQCTCTSSAHDWTMPIMSLAWCVATCSFVLRCARAVLHMYRAEVRDTVHRILLGVQSCENHIRGNFMDALQACPRCQCWAGRCTRLATMWMYMSCPWMHQTFLLRLSPPWIMMRLQQWGP